MFPRLITGVGVPLPIVSGSAGAMVRTPAEVRRALVDVIDPPGARDFPGVTATGPSLMRLIGDPACRAPLMSRTFVNENFKL